MESSEYYSKNFSVLNSNDTTFVLLNTCAHQTTPQTSKYGEIDDETISGIKEAIMGLETKHRVLVCHHHPFRHEALDREDESAIKGGAELIELLENNGQWMIIHGHRHYPNMLYGGGTNQSPLIVAAGSFSAILYPELTTRVRNQFLILNVEESDVRGTTSTMKGTVRAWEFHRGRGWVRPVSSEGIPDGTGFGYRGSIETLASEVRDDIRSNYLVGTHFPFSQIEGRLGELKYLLPRERQMLLKRINESEDIVVRPEENFATSSTDIFLVRKD